LHTRELVPTLQNNQMNFVMAKTPLFRALQKAFRIAQLTTQQGMPPADEMSEWLADQDLSRRHFIRGALHTGAVIGVSALLPDFLQPGRRTFTGSKSTVPKIAIIGGGIAGLNAGYTLLKSGREMPYTIYEASNRTGGRMFTAKLFGNDMTTELGGEFVDSNHTEILALAREFGIHKRSKTSDHLEPEVFLIDGKKHSFPELVRAFGRIRHRINTDSLSRGPNNDTPAAVHLDQMTMQAYLESLSADAWFKKLLEVAYVGEFGLEAEQQSALNLVDLINQKTGFKLFGESDENWKLMGGNQQICDRLAEKQQDSIRTGHKLIAVKSKGSGFTLTFSTGSGTKEVDADFVIMTLPFTILRDVDGIDKLEGMTPLKLRCIRELGYGTNGKMFLGLKNRPWRRHNHQGYLYANDIHTGWDNYHLQHKNAGPGAYTVFLGGLTGAGAAPDKATLYLPTLEKAFPGFGKSFVPEQTAAMNWTNHPHTKGSYICYKPGQWTTIKGQEGAPVGHMYFAGEHTSAEFSGFMNGAAVTGKEAASKVLEVAGR
jgi:monoamine oxidase